MNKSLSFITLFHIYFYACFNNNALIGNLEKTVKNMTAI